MKKITLLVLVLALVLASVSALAAGNPCANGHLWKGPTCTSPKTCVYCGRSVGNPLPHSYTWKITKPATCTSTGTKQGTCSCGATQTMYLPKDPNAHSWGSWYVIHPTRRARTCSRCGHTEYQSIK